MSLAWEAFCAGGLPVGAVVVNSAAQVVGQARNAGHEQAATPGQLLMTCHYFYCFYCRPGRGQASVPWRDENPDIVALAANPTVEAAVSGAASRDATLAELIDELRPLAAPQS